MPVAATTQWEVRTTGNANNGGGYSSGGTDYSLQNSPQLTVTDAAATATAALTSATGGFTSAMVGNVVNVVGQGRKQITAFTSSNSVTCDSAWGTFSGATANVGGALSGPEDADAAYVAGNTVWIAAGTYTKTTTRTLTADGSAPAGLRYIGYNSTRSETDIAEADMPIFTSATNSIAIFTLNAVSQARFWNIKVTHTAATRGNGWVNVTSVSTTAIWRNCICDGNLNGWLTTPTAATSFVAQCFNCTARNCTGTGTGSGGWVILYATGLHFFFNCVSHNNAGCGFACGTAGSHWFENCIIDSNGNVGIYSSATTGIPFFGIKNCVFYNNTGPGISWQFTTGSLQVPSFILNNIFESNSTYGMSSSSTGEMDGTVGWQIGGNAFYNNTTLPRNFVKVGEGDITLSGSAFVDAPNQDFTLNNNAGGGADCRGTGWWTRYGAGQALSMVSYPDIGAAQHDDPAGGSRSVVI